MLLNHQDRLDVAVGVEFGDDCFVEGMVPQAGS